MERITPTELTQLVLKNANEKQVDGYVCVGHGFLDENGESLIDLLGVDYKELYSLSDTTVDGEFILINGFFGSLRSSLYYITTETYAKLLETPIDLEKFHPFLDDLMVIESQLQSSEVG